MAKRRTSHIGAAMQDTVSIRELSDAQRAARERLRKRMRRGCHLGGLRPNRDKLLYDRAPLRAGRVAAVGTTVVAEQHGRAGWAKRGTHPTRSIWREVNRSVAARREHLLRQYPATPGLLGPRPTGTRRPGAVQR